MKANKIQANNYYNVITPQMQKLLEDLKSNANIALTHIQKSSDLLIEIYNQGKKDGLTKDVIRSLVISILKEVKGLRDRQIRNLLPDELKYLEFANKELGSNRNDDDGTKYREAATVAASPPLLRLRFDAPVAGKEVVKEQFSEITNKILCGDSLTVLKKFPDECIDTVICSPPYYSLRDYEIAGQLGREKNYTEYIDKLLEIFGEVKRVLKDTGSCWIVIADSYDSNKSLIGIPERLCISMKDEYQWILRSKIIWWKRNATPSSAKDRFTPDWEYVLFFTKSADNYYFKTQYEPHNPKYTSRYKSPFGGTKNKNGQGAFDYSRPRYIKPNPNGRIQRISVGYSGRKL